MSIHIIYHNNKLQYKNFCKYEFRNYLQIYNKNIVTIKNSHVKKCVDKMHKYDKNCKIV